MIHVLCLVEGCSDYVCIISGIRKCYSIKHKAEKIVTILGLGTILNGIKNKQKFLSRTLSMTYISAIVSQSTRESRVVQTVPGCAGDTTHKALQGAHACSKHNLVC